MVSVLSKQVTVTKCADRAAGLRFKVAGCDLWTSWGETLKY